MCCASSGGAWRAASARRKPGPSLASGEPAVELGQRPRILVAEDNLADVYLIRAALKEHGVDHPLQVVADGAEALRVLDERERCAEAQLDLIILDLNLPRHDGIEILERLHSARKLRGAPVVVLTSSDSLDDRTAAKQLGAARFLRKPSSLAEFLALGAVFKDLLSGGEATPPQAA
ncbi:MAG TPA: response regulator [Bryobacteraceae bacterium]|nr:response regulator [Bryobacteraceae bacterium]